MLMVAFIRRISMDDAFEIVRSQRQIIGIRDNVAEFRRAWLAGSSDVIIWVVRHPQAPRSQRQGSLVVHEF